MTDVPIFGGPLKKTIIARAYAMCGNGDADGIDQDQLETGIACADNVASTLGDLLGWNDIGSSSEDESGLVNADVFGFTVRVAQEIAQTMGKQFTPNGPQARASASLTAKYQATPVMQIGRQVPRGSGNRRYYGSRYFVAPISDTEPVQ